MATLTLPTGETMSYDDLVDYWFGTGVFVRMPDPMKDYLRENAGRNVGDVRATFRDEYPREAIQRLGMPVALAVGSRSPEVTHRIAGALTALAPRGSLVTLADADHALTTTHPEAVADLIAGLA